MRDRSRIGVVVVAYNSLRWLETCLRSIVEGSLPSGSDVILVDNASTDESIQFVQQRFPAVHVVASGRNRGFAGGANLGIQRTEGDIVVLLNPDVTLRAQAIDALARAMAADPHIGIAGCKLVYPAGKTVQHAGGRITYPLALADHYGYGQVDRGQFDRSREVDYVTGAAFAVRKSTVADVGYFDEGFFPAYYEEADLCLRARKAGYKVVYVSDAVAVHHESVTTGRDTEAYYRFYHRNRIRFVLKHYDHAQLWLDFMPAEEERLRELGASTETEALRAAYVDNLAVLEGRSTFFPSPLAGSPLPTSSDRRRLVRTLVEHAESLRGGGKGLVDSSSNRIATWKDRVARLRRSATLIETEFTSDSPVIGRLVARGRAAWNSVSTKWYVRPVLHQQSNFNQDVVEMLDQLSAELSRVSSVLERVIDRLDDRNLDVNAPRESLRAIELAVTAAERLAVETQREVARLNLRLAQTHDDSVEPTAAPGPRPSHPTDPPP